MVEYDDEDEARMREHQKIADERKTFSTPILVVAAVVLFFTIAWLILFLVRASKTVTFD
jgi:hypothetical protein